MVNSASGPASAASRLVSDHLSKQGTFGNKSVKSASTGVSRGTQTTTIYAKSFQERSVKSSASPLKTSSGTRPVANTRAAVAALARQAAENTRPAVNTNSATPAVVLIKALQTKLPPLPKKPEVNTPKTSAGLATKFATLAKEAAAKATAGTDSLINNIVSAKKAKIFARKATIFAIKANNLAKTNTNNAKAETNAAVNKTIAAVRLARVAPRTEQTIARQMSAVTATISAAEATKTALNETKMEINATNLAAEATEKAKAVSEIAEQRRMNAQNSETVTNAKNNIPRTSIADAVNDFNVSVQNAKTKLANTDGANRDELFDTIINATIKLYGTIEKSNLEVKKPQLTNDRFNGQKNTASTDVKARTLSTDAPLTSLTTSLGQNADAALDQLMKNVQAASMDIESSANRDLTKLEAQLNQAVGELYDDLEFALDGPEQRYVDAVHAAKTDSTVNTTAGRELYDDLEFALDGPEQRYVDAVYAAKMDSTVNTTAGSEAARTEQEYRAIADLLRNRD